jgi:archaellum biogenesis ATPase FlaH
MAKATDKPNYTQAVQQLFLELFLSNGETYVRCQNIFDPENFDPALRSSAEFIKKYSDQYKTIPDVKIVNAATRCNLEKHVITDQDCEWLLDEFERFSRHKALERAILTSADLLEQGDYGPVETMIRNAVQISLSRDMGTDYFADPKGRLQKLRDRNGQVSTGWPSLDTKLFGGINRGELNIFCASSGGGKSLFLANLAVNWSLQGLDVIYFTFELSEELVGLRLDSMLTSIPSREIFRNIDEVELRVRQISRKAGSIRVKYMPSGKTANDLRAYLKEYQIRTGKVPDVVLIDYLDLMMPISAKINAGDLYTKDKFVSEELRNLAMEIKMLTVTASQLNRCLSLDTEVVCNGTKIQIKDVKPGDWIESNEGPVQITEKLTPTTQPVYKITTRSGKVITASANHKFPTKDGLKTINSGLTIEDQLWVQIDITRDCQSTATDEIVSIEYVGEQPTIDINVTGNRLFWANGILTHNSAVEEVEFDHSHIAGGLSKIQTADNVFGIFTSRAMRERGRYQVQFLKTRNSGSVGQKIELDFDINTLRITDAGPDTESEPQPSVYQQLKRTSQVTTVTDTAPVRGMTGTARIRDLINQINKQE